MSVSIPSGFECPLGRRHVLDRKHEVEIVVLARLLAEQRVNTPAAIEPDLDAWALERLHQNNHSCRFHPRTRTTTVHAMRVPRCSLGHTPAKLGLSSSPVTCRSVKPDEALRSRAAISAITRLPRSIARVKIALGCPSAVNGPPGGRDG
jgi:hypothetical protein